MNGETYQICNITACAKKALRDNTDIIYIPGKYKESIQFQFAEKKSWFSTKPNTADNTTEWFDKCRRKGLEDIKFMSPPDFKDKHLLGFSNARPKAMVCFYKNGKVTYFNPHWYFDKENEGWNITYTENVWDNPPEGKPKFNDNSEAFIKILNEIADFARTIEFGFFADLFQRAALAVTGIFTEKPEISLPLPVKNLNIFMAANIADIFGAMGSWNDSPPCVAHEKNLDKQYSDLSSELYKQLTLAILYAINEW